MPRFVINRNEQDNGDHEVHNLDYPCQNMPYPENQIDLGYHMTCHTAVDLARGKWPGKRINGCFWCANACHTT